MFIKGANEQPYKEKEGATGVTLLVTCKSVRKVRENVRLTLVRQ
jgi:hypothetical protein